MWTTEKSCIIFKEEDREILFYNRIIRVPWNWLISGGRTIKAALSRLEHFSVILGNSRTRVFVFKGRRYTILDNEIVEVIIKNCFHFM